MQTTTAAHPLKIESEVHDHSQDETKLATTVDTASNEEIHDEKHQIDVVNYN